MREKKLRVDELTAPWTAKKVVRWTAGWFEERDVTETPRLDADLLLSQVLDASRVELYTKMDEELTSDQLGQFKQLIKRRAAGEPVAYLVGHREFRKLDLKTDERALVPRPDTETLIDVVLELLSSYEGETPYKVAEIGTGTGAIALALVDENDDANVVASEISEEALQLARENLSLHDAETRVALFHGDLLEPIPDEAFPVDFVVSNPPYVAEDEYRELDETVREFEPAEALLAGDDGLEVIRRLIPAAEEKLKSGGWLAFEIGHQQGDSVRELLEEAEFEEVEIHQDMGDRDRVAVGRRE